jgi:hypothetical protein
MGLFRWIQSMKEAPPSKMNLHVEGTTYKRGRWMPDPPTRGTSRGLIRFSLFGGGGTRKNSPVFETWTSEAGRHYRDTGMDDRSWREMRRRVERDPRVQYEDDQHHWAYGQTWPGHEPGPPPADPPGWGINPPEPWPGSGGGDPRGEPPPGYKSW